jgi:di/tricarboxylate transporter
MAVGIASILGGNLTLAGSTPQIVVQGILAQTEGCEPMSFFDLSKGAIPLMLTMLVYFLTIGFILQKKTFRFQETTNTKSSATNTQVDRKKAPVAGIIFCFCIVAFVFEIATLGTVAVVAACACIVTGCITIDRAAVTMDWTSILVLGGSLSFSKGLSQSGALQMLADALIGLMGPNATPFMLFALFLILPALIGNFMSSTATAAIIAPIAIAVAMEMGSNPLTFAIGVVFACSLSLATPVSTPPLTMTLIGGYRFSDYIVVGGLLSILCMVVALITLPLLYGL